MHQFQSQKLSRDEIALIGFYRQLTQEKQRELLERAETGANSIKRMRELAGRLVETGLFEGDAGYA